MRQWAVDLSGQARRPGGSITHTCTLPLNIGAGDLLCKEECVLCFISAELLT